MPDNSDKVAGTIVTQCRRNREFYSTNWVFVFNRIIWVERDVCSFNPLCVCLTTAEPSKWNPTIKTKSRSSRIRASWISKDTLSRLSSRDLPFP